MNFIPLAAAQPQGGGIQMIVMLVGLFAIVYFFMIRPQNKKQKEIQKFRNALEVGQDVITIGGMLLGWIAGGMLVTDPAVADHVSAWQPQIKYIAEVGGALLVLLIGTLSARRQKSKGA